MQLDRPQHVLQTPSLSSLLVIRYFMYKAPVKDQLTGVEYIYIDAAEVDVMTPASVPYKPINHLHGVLANTLKPLFTNIRTMVRTNSNCTLLLLSATQYFLLHILIILVYCGVSFD